MADDNRDKWRRLPKVSFNRKVILRRMRKVEGVTLRHAHKFIVKRWSSVREVQQQIIIWILGVGILIAATGLQLMWYQQSYKTVAPTNDGTYAEAVLGPVDTLNPLFATTSAEQSASYLMFSRLLRYDKTGNLNHDLVTSIKLNDAKNVYTVSIRSDAKWNDGVKLTTDDIDYTIKLIKNPSVRSKISGWENVTVKVINETTIEFALKSTYSAFEHALTFPIVPKHILGNISPSAIRENEFSQNPVGSGPFKIRFVQEVDTKSNRKVIYMARNDNYYGGYANLARYQLHVYDSADAIVRALSSNEVNAAADLSPVDIQNINDKRYEIYSNPIQSGVYALLNTKSELLKDINLRRALQLSTDSNAIINKLPKMDSKPPLIDLPFTNGQLSGDVPKVQAFNKQAAEKILTDNGWVLNANGSREKSGVPFKISVVTMKSSELENVLETLVGQWRSIGISVDTQVVDPNDITQNVSQNVLQPRNYDVLLYQLNIGADPDVYAYWHSSQATALGSNFSNYSNIISDDALSSARSRIEPALRNAKYITFAKQWLGDVPAIGLYQSTAQYVRSKNVKSFEPSTILISPIDRYSDVLNWSVGTKTVYKTP